ncbi:hypothetical protein [Selenomonas sp. AB3002]|uniref:hypothetical protein n=1 Tax=Selenomonas sp. AB3002 TaxID=1392502 RepID=UPI000565A976
MAKKDAMGQEIDSLYLSLGLDIADLELGFQTAGQTVRQAMSRLNSEAKQIRLQADIDVTKLETAGKYVDALKAKEKALTDELAVQQKKLDLLNRAYQSNAQTYGTDHALTRGVDTKRLYQQKDIAQLQARIAQVNAELAKTAQVSTGAFGKLASAAQNAQGRIVGTVGAISKLNGAITGIVAGVSAGAGIFALTDKAMNAGNDLYKLSSRLHTTTAEASKLQKVFRLSGVDIDSVVPIFARLDKQVLASAKSQNALSIAMAEFGFSLTDSNGNLLSYEQQLAQLAGAYQKAIASGREAEFVRDVLGAKGAQLVPLLQDYATNMEIVSRIKTTGLLNPKEAHELYIEWQAMQMQAGQLTGAIGQALMPVASELMPEITAGFAEFAKLISDNKEGIKEFGRAAGTAVGGLASTLTALIGVLGDVKKAIGEVTTSAEDLNVLKELGYGDHVNRGKMLGTLAGGVGGFMAGGVPGAMVGAGVGANAGEGIFAGWAKLFSTDEEVAAAKKRLELKEQERKSIEEFEKQRLEATKTSVGESVKLEKQASEVKAELEKNLAGATSQRLREQLDAIKDKVQASIDQGTTEAAAWVKVSDDIKKAMKDAAKEAKEANEALDRSIYSLTHNDLQNSLRGVENSAKDTLKKGADPEKVALEESLKKGKIIEAHEKEVAQYLDGIYADSLTQRLNQIEREKRAWIQKGLDEVQATRAAEEQKKQATNDAVKNMFTSQKKYLDTYRKALRGDISGSGMQIIDRTLSPEARQQNAVKALQRQMMREAGVPSWESTNMQEVLGFQKAMKEANNWGANMVKDGGDLSQLSNVLAQGNEQVTGILGQINGEIPQMNNNLQQILGAIQQKSNPPQINVNPSINVNLGGAYVFDNAMKKQLTDDITRDVANGVTSAVEQATSRLNTSYGN